VTISQNDRRVALFFDTFATSYAGTSIRDGRLEARACFTDSAFLRLRRRAPFLLRDEVIVSLRALKKVRPNKRPA
jgi:hypothetical protein